MTGDCNCGCKSDCHDHGPRKVLTNEEKLTHLKKYKEDLKKTLSRRQNHKRTQQVTKN